MLHGEPERDAGAERVAQDIDLREPELFDQLGHVVALIGEAECAVAEAAAAMALEIDQDDAAPLGEDRQLRLEHLARTEPAVQQQQRLTAAADLVVVANAVDREGPVLRGLCGSRGARGVGWHTRFFRGWVAAGGDREQQGSARDALTEV